MGVRAPAAIAFVDKYTFAGFNKGGAIVDYLVSNDSFMEIGTVHLLFNGGDVTISPSQTSFNSFSSWSCNLIDNEVLLKVIPPIAGTYNIKYSINLI